jgi:hypothetical protein
MPETVGELSLGVVGKDSGANPAVMKALIAEMNPASAATPVERTSRAAGGYTESANMMCLRGNPNRCVSRIVARFVARS